MANTIRYFACVPNSTNLCCIVAKINLTEVQDSSAKSNFHWKTMKCRLLIDTMKDAIIASPLSMNDSSIYVIVGVEFFKTRVLQNCLKEMNMTWSLPTPVTPDVYANCLRYSILFGLAPRWNRIGEFLVYGKEFLTKAKNTAIRFDLKFESRCDKDKACMRLQPINLRLNNLMLEKLGLPEGIVAQFLMEPDGFIDIDFFGNYRVTVLPSLKRGRLMAALKRIPLSSTFNNYNELRRHWKNMYGYRLPQTDNELIYYVVYFPMPVNEHFLYPNICVTYQVQDFPYIGNRDLFVGSFLQDVHDTLPMICGEPLRFVAEDIEIENSSFVAASSCFKTKNEGVKGVEMGKTPELIGKAPTINAQSTTRLSMSCLTPKHQQLDRTSSTMMSPTPSLRGSLKTDETTSDKLRGILTTIARFREANSSTRFSRIKDNPVETQNQCPNVGETGAKTISMDIDSNEPRVFMPHSNFAASTSQCEKKPIFGRLCNSTSGPSTSSHCNSDAEMKGLIKNSETVSKYFDESDMPNKKLKLTTSQDSEKVSLREKLLKNMLTVDKKMNYE